MHLAVLVLALALPPSSPVQDQTAEQVVGAQELPPGWVEGPGEGKLGDRARVVVPEGFFFGDADGARRWLEANENPTSGDELGILTSLDPEPPPSKRFTVLFSFEDTGYVKDEDRDELDADALMESMKAGNAAGNELRKERGWETVELVGWKREPFYDARTNNLTWATLLRAPSGGEYLNWSLRVLGRNGVMHVNLVTAPDTIDAALPEFEKFIDSFEYLDGQRYAQFTTGDKVAEYGLAALVLGGGAAVAAKTGLLSKLLKPILIGLAAIAAFAKKIWGWFTGRSRPEEPGTESR